MASIIKNFLNKEELILLQKYCYNKLDKNEGYKFDGKIFSPAWYMDPLMTGLLDIKKYDNWPIVVEDKSFELEEGDAVLYKGIDEKHGRPGVYEGEGMAQLFLHYVDKNGLHTKHAYDRVYKDNYVKE